jgi:type II secretory pathway component GspD/PulD (secretin)
MKNNGRRFKGLALGKGLWRALCLLSALELALLPGMTALAQSDSSTPEANPQFQNSVQGSRTNSGSPVGSVSAVKAHAASASKALDQESSSSQAGAPSSGIQIGASTPPTPPRKKRVPSPLDTRVSIRVKGAPLATFLDAISAQAKINFLVSEGLESVKITAFLQKVTVREALQILLEIKGLTYRQIGKSNTYVIKKRSKNAPNFITRIYSLSYIPLVNIGQQANQGQQGGMGGAAGGMAGMLGGMGSPSAGGSSGGPAPGGAGGPSGGLMPGQGGQALGMGSMMGGASGGGGQQGMGGMPGAGSGGASSIVTVVQSVLTKAGRVAVDPRTNSLIVTDVPEVFPQVDQLIAELDKKVPQIMIEAQIVEIDSNRANDLGFEWGGPNGEMGTFTGGQRDTSFPMVLTSATGQPRFFDPVQNVMSTLALEGGGMMGGGMGGGAGGGMMGGMGTTLGGIGSTGGTLAIPTTQPGINPLTGLPMLGSSVMTSVLNLSQLTITLRMLVSRSEARYLGKPKILTVNNTPAMISITGDTAVYMSEQTTGGGAGITQATYSPVTKNTGLTLTVTPQVNGDGYITMSVNPEFVDVQPAVVSSAANPVYDTLTRMAQTLVRVKNGETLVLGGLLHSTEQKTVRKVPFLGYIPVIGWLFTSVQAQRKNTDLVIFITPTIIND